LTIFALLLKIWNPIRQPFSVNILNCFAYGTVPVGSYHPGVSIGKQPYCYDRELQIIDLKILLFFKEKETKPIVNYRSIHT